MYKLDHGGKDQEKLRKALPSLAQIMDHQEGWRDDFQLNSTLRRGFRVPHYSQQSCYQTVHSATPRGGAAGGGLDWKAGKQKGGGVMPCFLFTYRYGFYFICASG